MYPNILKIDNFKRGQLSEIKVLFNPSTFAKFTQLLLKNKRTFHKDAKRLHKDNVLKK